MAFAVGTILSVALLGYLFTTIPSVNAAPADDFVTTWKTDSASAPNDRSITLPVEGAGYDYDVDWNNDGVFDEFNITTSVTHEFDVAGTHTIRIQGSFPRIKFSVDILKLVDINQWGTGEWVSFNNAFNGANNLTISATDAPNLSNVTDMSSMFANNTTFNSDVSHWDTSNVTDMHLMFYGALLFNQNISSWDTGNVTNMYAMFAGTTAFNQNISIWDTGKVTDMSVMFSGAEGFDQNLGSWDMSSVTNLISMLFQSGLSTENYDALLTGWASQTLQPNVILGAHQLVYCDAADARQFIIDTFGWQIGGDFVCAEVQEQAVTNVSFSQEGDKQFMIVAGTGLVGVTSPTEFIEGTTRSLVTLNQEALPFCAFGGYSAETLKNLFGMPPGLVSDTPLCYELTANGQTASITPTEARIWLPDGYDTEAPGSVSVNGSPVFNFNESTSEPVTPTAESDGESLEGTPTIANRPTFSGKAEPGSTVTVTVRSDPVVCTTVASSTGDWSCTLPSDLVAGVHSVTIVVQLDDISTTLGPFAVRVAGDGSTTLTPGSLPSAPNTGFLANESTVNNAHSSQFVLLAGIFGSIAAVLSVLAIRFALQNNLYRF